MSRLKSSLALVLLYSCLQAQTIQFQFCGKTETVADLNKRGNAAIKLDFIKIGIRGWNQVNIPPFYVLGNQENVTKNDNFKNKVSADGCPGTNNTGACTPCSTCAFVESTTSANLGNAIGKLVGSVKVETNNNDLYIMCTDVNNVVCYETHKISLAGQSNKKLDVLYKVEGIAKDNISQVRNMSLNYRFNNDNYFSTPYFFNKNSNNVGVFEELGSIQASVPVATEDLSKKLSFNIAPNPTHDILNVKLKVYQDFPGFITIIGANGGQVFSEATQFTSSQENLELRVSDLTTGQYILYLSDEDGRSSFMRFQKI